MDIFFYEDGVMARASEIREKLPMNNSLVLSQILNQNPTVYEVLNNVVTNLLTFTRKKLRNFEENINGGNLLDIVNVFKKLKLFTVPSNSAGPMKALDVISVDSIKKEFKEGQKIISTIKIALSEKELVRVFDEICDINFRNGILDNKNKPIINEAKKILKQILALF